MAVGRPGTAAVLLGADRLLPGRAVGGQRRHAVVHGVAARRLRADDRRARLPGRARERRVQAENRCGQGYLGASADAGHGRAHRRPRRRWSCPPCTPSPTGRSARRACCPTCSGSAATPSAPRTWPGCSSSPASAITNTATARSMAGSECVPVLLTALGAITGTDTGRRRLRRDGGDGADDAVVADRRPAPAGLARAVRRAARPGRPRGARPDVQRHLDGAGGGRAGRCCTLAAARRRRRTRRPRARRSCRRRSNRDAGGHAGAVRVWPPSRWSTTSAGR